MISFRSQGLSANLKLLAIVYMAIYSFIKFSFDIKLILVIVLFLPFLTYHIFISFNINAAVEEAVRYFFPLVILIYSYSIRKNYLLLINFIIIFTIINNLYQIVIYFKWFIGVQQYFYYQVPNTNIYYYNSLLGIIRGVGLMGFFGTYGFLNLISFFLARQFYFGKYKKAILVMFIIGVFASLSFKAIGVFLFLLFLLSKYKLKLLFVGLSISLMGLVMFPKRTYDFVESFTYRVEVYITTGNSARSESYRVMFEDIGDLKFIGRGVGSFGGASSTRYNSPVYKEVDFNWYNTKHLATTDTYFPHVFVELGILGGLLYFLTILAPLLKRRYLKDTLLLIFVIYFALFFDSLFSFALNNLNYLVISLILVYPILEHEKNLVYWKRRIK